MVVCGVKYLYTIVQSPLAAVWDVMRVVVSRSLNNECDQLLMSTGHLKHWLCLFLNNKCLNIYKSIHTYYMYFLQTTFPGLVHMQGRHGAVWRHRFHQWIFKLPQPCVCCLGAPQQPHLLSEDAASWTGWEPSLSMKWGKSCEASCITVMPLRASSSRAMRMKAASTFWASLADVSRAASILLFSARVHASSNNTCLWDWRSDLLPAAMNRAVGC